MSSVARVTIRKVSKLEFTETEDLLASEEPLEIRLGYAGGGRVQQSISVTMRTPGNDAELAAGFLFTEGIIQSWDDVEDIVANENNENIIVVTLRDGVQFDAGKLKRNFYTTSSCGVCGKASIEAVRQACAIPEEFDWIKVPATAIYRLPEELRRRQAIFEHTGGLHGCALFSIDGNLLLTREDVGRHNALDKLIGVVLQQKMIPLTSHILLLSGRASFELIQKAVMAGIRVVAAVGAPSSLAADVAEEWGMTLIGFLRGERFNIYSGAERIIFE